MATIGSRHRNPFWHWWTPWRTKWIENVRGEHLPKMTMLEAQRAAGYIKSSLEELLLETGLLDSIPWSLERRNTMDMEMKKNLAVAAERAWQTDTMAAGSKTETIINWLDEKGFLTDPTTKKDAASNPLFLERWQKAVIDGILNPSAGRTFAEIPRVITPRRIHDLDRAQEIASAMIDYAKAGWEIPREWTDEYNEIRRRIRG